MMQDVAPRDEGPQVVDFRSWAWPPPPRPWPWPQKPTLGDQLASWLADHFPEVDVSDTLLTRAGQLQELLPSLQLPKLLQGQDAELRLDRNLVAALLANALLGTLPDVPSEAMPRLSFDRLVQVSIKAAQKAPQEKAKLRMVLHYFERIGVEPLRGFITIYRRTLQATREHWRGSAKPLLPLEVARDGVGFEGEETLGCLHADFANMFIGGGVLSGGCVQEEIRFAICPENMAAMCVCPAMLASESITIEGAEQFSAYKGYGTGRVLGLQYAGDHVDRNPRDADGTVRVALCAMDALDFRSEPDASLQRQVSFEPMMRELVKAAAAFAPVNARAAELWPSVATGNWGCGVFGGAVVLKALLQWIAASECGRAVRYFPFDERGLGATLRRTSALSGVTVGCAVAVLLELGDPTDPFAATLRKDDQEALFGEFVRRCAKAAARDAAGPD